MSEANELYAARIIGMTDARKEIVTGPDGFRYWWPGREGAISSAELRVIADELDKRNYDWNRQILLDPKIGPVRDDLITQLQTVDPHNTDEVIKALNAAARELERK